MAILTLRPAPFFADKNRAFWTLQIAGWGGAFLLRAIGDVGVGRWSWLSPLGWVHRVRPFAGERWWVLSLSLLTVVLGSAVALGLSDHRDLGCRRGR